MLPEPVMIPVCIIRMHVGPIVTTANVAHNLRVDVVLEDPSRIVPHYIDKWSVFLPSDLPLDCIQVHFMFLCMWLWVHVHVLLLCVCVFSCTYGLCALSQVCVDLQI